MLCVNVALLAMHTAAISFAAAFPLQLVYGRQCESHQDSLIQKTDEAVAMLTSSMFPGAIALNIFPWCKRVFLPLSSRISMVIFRPLYLTYRSS